MKIMVVHGQYSAAEVELRRKHVLAAASPGTQIEFVQIKGDIFGLSHNADSELLIMLAGPQVVEKAQDAQNRGLDAVVPYGGLDIGVDAARAQVDIPVVGMGRSGFCIAASMATRLGAIVYQSMAIPNAWKAIRQTGLKGFVISLRAVDISLKDMTTQSTLLKERLFELGKKMVHEEGIEVLVIKGVSLVPNHCSADELSREVGVPVIDCVTAGIKMAEMLVNMRLGNSRKAYPAP
jgi:allantoin racemase